MEDLEPTLDFELITDLQWQISTENPVQDPEQPAATKNTIFNLKIVNLVAVKTGYSAFLTPGSQTHSFDLGGYFLSIKLSGMGKNQDPGSVINIPYPQNWDIYM